MYKMCLVHRFQVRVRLYPSCDSLYQHRFFGERRFGKRKLRHMTQHRKLNCYFRVLQVTTRQDHVDITLSKLKAFPLGMSPTKNSSNLKATR